MDAAADPLRTVRPEEGDEKPKAAESQDDGYETSNSGEARRKPSSAEGSPAPPRTPPPEPAFEPLMQRPFPSPYRHFEQPAPPAPPPPHDEPYQHQHFPFPKYPQDPYAFKRDADVPYDMSQHQIHQYGPPKRDDDMYNGVKRECEDPYSFVEEEAMCAMLGQHHMPHMQHHDPHHHMQMHPQQMMLNQPKKRGRKKKIKDENGMEIKVEPGMEGALVARPIKERKKHDRFNGMSEEEVSRRTLPDHLAENLDIIIIGINPGLFAAYKGHHYAGPGNHFWKCLYLSGLTREQMSADEDYKLLNFGIGFTNMVARPTKGSADLTRREIKEGSAILLEKLQTFRPKVAVFNGKLIYEVFSGKKDFCFGKQPDTIAGTNTYMWVMPSSSARCAQLPRAADKVPFYAALKKFRDYLNGLQPHVDEAELIFPDTTGRRPQEEMEIRRLTMEPEPGDTIILEDGTEVPLKKKRGRPKKVKLENGETAPPVPRAPRQPRPPPVLDPNGELPPKKKRGRPKKIRPEEQQFLMQQQQQQQQQQQANSMIQPQLSLSQLPHEQQFLHGEFPQQMASPIPQSMMYGVQHQQMPDGSPYYQPNNAGGMDSPLEVGGGGGGLLSRGYASPGGAGAAGYASSPRAVYASPRSQPYSPTPQRLAATPQPQHQDLSAPQQFPSSPAAFSAPSPPRAPYSSPGVGGVGNVGGVGVGNVGNVGGVGSRSFAARSPLYASSPAAYRQQPSPAAQPRFSHEMPFSRDATPQAQSAPYARSPAPAGVVGVVGGGSTPFPAASPAGALHSYTPSPAHTPYSHHSSPAPTYTESHHFSNQGAGGGSGGGGGGSGGFSTELSSDIGAAISSPGPVSPGMAALDFEPPRSDHSPMGSTDMHPGSNSNSSLSDYNKQSNPGGAELSPAAGGGAVGGAFGGAMYDEGRLQYQDKPDYHYQQEQAPGVAESPRLDQMHQHPSMYPSNYNRSTPTGEEDSNFGRAPPFRTLSEHAPGSPGEYGNTGEGGTPKGKSQDVASKSLSGLESLVDQIPSIAEGGAGAGAGPAPSGGDPAPPAPLPDYAPALYPPYPAYGAPTYGNNGYGGPFVGYGGGWGTQLMRPAPGYLPDWQYGYAPGVAPPYAAYNAPYYNGYAPPPAHHQQTHYLSAPPLLELHKSGEHAPAVPSVPSVGFGGFC